MTSSTQGVAGERSIEDLVAGNAFRDTLMPRADADYNGAPLWYGWALVDAFLAGLDHARKSVPSPDSKLEAYRKALAAACGYLTNAKIDLQTGCTKATEIKTIEDGLTMIKQALAAGARP
jgi:hypothetical protein